MYKTLPSILVFVLATLVAGAAEPEMRLSSKRIRDEVREVVVTQLAALRTGDFSAAYGYASAGIKAQFNEEIFAAMIRRGYSVLVQAKSADLGVVRDKDGGLAQVDVSVLDREKHTVVYRYWLVHEPDGWRINGVTLEQSPPRGNI